jgi:hypothetical protein
VRSPAALAHLNSSVVADKKPKLGSPDGCHGEFLYGSLAMNLHCRFMGSRNHAVSHTWMKAFLRYRYGSDLDKFVETLTRRFNPNGTEP